MPVFINPITGQMSYVPLGAGYYVHPATHSADIIDQTSSRRFVSDIQIAGWNSKAEGVHSHLNATPGVQGFMSGSDKTKLDAISGINTGNETAATLGATINATTEKATPVDTDLFALVDSAAGSVIKKHHWSSLKTALSQYFNSLYNNYTHPNNDGYKHVPVTGTTNNAKFLKAGATAGSFAWALLTNTDIPTGITATKIAQTATSRFVSDTQIAAWERVKSKPINVVLLIQYGSTVFDLNNGFDFSIINFNNDEQGTSLQFSNLVNGDSGTIIVKNHNGAVVPLVFSSSGAGYTAIKKGQGYAESVVANGITIITYKYQIDTIFPTGVVHLNCCIYE